MTKNMVIRALGTSRRKESHGNTNSATGMTGNELKMRFIPVTGERRERREYNDRDENLLRIIRLSQHSMHDHQERRGISFLPKLEKETKNESSSLRQFEICHSNTCNTTSIQIASEVVAQRAINPQQSARYQPPNVTATTQLSLTMKQAEQ